MAEFIVVAEPKSEFGFIIRELIFVDGTDEKNWEALTTAREQLGDKYHVRRAYEGWVPSAQFGAEDDWYGFVPLEKQ